MTGYGVASVRHGGWSWTAEIRSVNQRGLEVRFNMPREYAPWESELRALVQQHAERGKVDILIQRMGRPESTQRIRVNETLARAYVVAWREMQTQLHLGGDIGIELLANRPELFAVEEVKLPAEDEHTCVRRAVELALAAWNRERTREGKALQRDLRRRLATLERCRRAIARRIEQILPQLVARLRQRTRELLEGRELDEQRLLQEAVLVAERSDVTEELVRLDTHLQAARELLRQGGSLGKRLEFLLQEMHREFNTIAAKSADTEVTRATIEARSEIEKIREQVQNVE